MMSKSLSVFDGGDTWSTVTSGAIAEIHSTSSVVSPLKSNGIFVPTRVVTSCEWSEKRRLNSLKSSTRASPTVASITVIP